jgi:hypothetical protein
MAVLVREASARRVNHGVSEAAERRVNHGTTHRPWFVSHEPYLRYPYLREETVTFLFFKKSSHPLNFFADLSTNEFI